MTVVRNRRPSLSSPIRRDRCPPVICRHSSRMVSARPLSRASRSSGRTTCEISWATTATRPWSDREAHSSTPTDSAGRWRHGVQNTRAVAPEVISRRCRRGAPSCVAHPIQELERGGGVVAPVGRDRLVGRVSTRPGADRAEHQRDCEEERQRRRPVPRHPGGTHEGGRGGEVDRDREQHDRCHPDRQRPARVATYRLLPPPAPAGRLRRGTPRASTTSARRTRGPRAWGHCPPPGRGRRRRDRRRPDRPPPRPGPVSGASCPASPAA